jgi:type III restriction enzyme
MFRDQPGGGYPERVDIIGNQTFLEFVDDLEKLEDIKFGEFEVGKDKVKINTIMPVEGKKKFDIGIPVLSAVLVRKKSLADEIASLDVMSLKFPPIPMRRDDEASKTFQYEGYDIITLEKEIEREYTIPQPQTAQEVIGYYARRIAEKVKLPSQFAAIAPKLREFFEERAFGKKVNLESAAIIQAMATPVAHFVTVKTFAQALSALAVSEREPTILEPERKLSTCPPFPWSRQTYEAQKTVFNLVALDNDYEGAFAKFLQSANDVKAFAKLPARFGFAVEYLDDENNLRLYYPDFVVLDADGVRHLIETKGVETAEVKHKDAAAKVWCENATSLTGKKWAYTKVLQPEFTRLQPKQLADLAALEPASLF